MKTPSAAVALACAASLACGGTEHDPESAAARSTGAPTTPGAALPPSPAMAPLPAQNVPPAAAPALAGGEVRWVAPLGDEQATALAFDAAGNVYVTTVGTPQGGARPPAHLVRFGPAGERIWSVALAGDRATHVAALPDGDALVAICATECDSGTGGISVARISSAGTVAWSTRLGADSVASLGADPEGRAVVLAVKSGALPRVMVLRGDGGIALNIAVEEGCRTSAAGAGGDIVVAGQDPSTARPFVARLGSDGALRWRRLLDAARGAIDRVALSPGGSIALAGWFDERLRWGSVTHARYVVGISGFLAVADGDGTPRWSIADPQLRPSGTPPSVLGYAAGDRITIHTTTTEQRASTLRTHSGSGSASWRHEFRGATGTSVHCVGVSPNGEVAVGATGAGDAPFVNTAGSSGASFVAVLAP